MCKLFRSLTPLIGFGFIFLMSACVRDVSVPGSNGDAYFAKRFKFSIGIYGGKSILDLNPIPNIENPVLTAEDVSDRPALFVADPFMVRENSTWYMFFEIMNSTNYQGDIGLATSNDAVNWHYRQVVLDEPFHLSYPYVFKWNGEYYMIPETYQAKSIRLYKAANFPTDWKFVKTLLTGNDFVDSSIFYFDNRWWLFTTTSKLDGLYLFYSDNLAGQWIEHPQSPVIIGDKNITRPGGRVLVVNDEVIRFTQDDYPTYGNQLRAFKIIGLTTSNYKEAPLTDKPILSATGTGWNAKGMHQIDLHKMGDDNWIACVDGYYITPN